MDVGVTVESFEIVGVLHDRTGRDKPADVGVVSEVYQKTCVSSIFCNSFFIKNSFVAVEPVSLLKIIFNKLTGYF